MNDREKALKWVIFKLIFSANLQNVRETGQEKKPQNLCQQKVTS